MASVQIEEVAVRAMRGQIIAIFALMLVVIMGFAGMAIDLAQARAVAENEQRAADAGALAGVVYLPGSTVNATTYAAQLSTANGFTDNCTGTSTCGVPGAIQISYAPDGPTRILREQITEQVPTTFLRVLGINSISVVKAATATYADPIQMGAPDNMLGFAARPSQAVQSCATTPNPVLGTNCQSYNPYGQGFYLELRGPWATVENGDAYSPYFENFSGNVVKGTDVWSSSTSKLTTCGPTATPPSPTNPKNLCTDAAGNTHTVILNPMYGQQDPYSNTSSGYNFVFSFPPNMQQPALIKLFDPLDECPNGPPSPQDVTAPDGPATGSPVSQIVSKTFLDQCGSFVFNTEHPTTLQASVYEPTTQLGQADKTVLPPPQMSGATPPKPLWPIPNEDPNGSTTTWELWTASAATGGFQQPFGQDVGNNHGYQWFTYAKFQNHSSRTMYVRLNVAAVMNADGTGGTAGNVFALGVCKANINGVADPGVANLGDQTSSNEWTPGSTDGTGAPTNGDGGYDTGCADPNIDDGTTSSPNGYGCSDGTTTCYHVSALGSLCIETLQQKAGQAIIPLAQLDQHFADSVVTLRLFDSGDIGGGGANLLNILGPNTDPTGPTYEPFAMDLSAPAYTDPTTGAVYNKSGYSQKGWGRGPNPWFGNTAPGNSQCPADYNADSYPNGDGPLCPSLSELTHGYGISTGVYPAFPGPGNAFGNGAWMDFHIHIPFGYKPIGGNEWWKVLYNISYPNITDPTKIPPTSDTTTWAVTSNAAPVHLINTQ